MIRNRKVAFNFVVSEDLLRAGDEVRKADVTRSPKQGYQ